MKKRAIILLVCVGTFVGMVMALPDAVGMKPSRLARKLPMSFENWVGRPEEPGAREKEILAKDTEFERMQYFDREGILPSVEVSIVFAGKNVSQSIHQPEVCLRAQGWEFVEENYFSWTGLLPSGEVLPVKEMICRRVWQRENEEGDPVDVILDNGDKAYIWKSFYYTFFGHEQIVSGHYQRTGVDIKDRLLNGYDQRWAYATFSSFVTKKHAEQGLPYWADVVLDEDGTRKHIESFLIDLLPLVVAAPGEGYDESLVSEGTLKQ